MPKRLATVPIGASETFTGGSPFALAAGSRRCVVSDSVGRSVQKVRPLQMARPDRDQAAAADLDRSLVKGIAWTSVVTWLSQILSWGSTLVVVHYLAPSDYGLIGMAWL